MSGAEVRERLAALVGGGGLRGSVAAAARDLLARLSAPVRVALFGRPGTGKTTLLNDLAGAALFPPALPLPTILLIHGPRQTVRAVLGDGGERTWEGLPLAEIAAISPAMVTVEAPLPALEGLRLLKVAAGDDPSDLAGAMAWAARQCDIAVWCSAGFDPEEAAIWARAPESLRANAFLACRGSTASSHGFLGAHDVSRRSDGLAADLRRCAERGRQAQTDHALLFLSRYAPQAAPTRAPAATPGSAAAPPSPAPSRPALHLASTAEVPAPPIPAAASTAPASAPDAAPAPPAPEAPAARHPAEPDVARICAEAALLLRDRARDLLARLPGYGQKPAEGVLGHCLETVEALADRVVAARAPDLSDMVLDVMDAIVLLQGEGGTAQAADSVTLLLQLRRDLEARQAA